MARGSLCAVVVGVWVCALGATGTADREPTTWTGWFSDVKCATPRVARGLIGPNNPACVTRCLDEGATPVFISEQAKALFEVKAYPKVRDDVGYHIELTGIVDDDANSITVQSVKRLAYVGASCGLPKRTGAASQPR